MASDGLLPGQAPPRPSRRGAVPWVMAAAVAGAGVLWVVRSGRPPSAPAAPTSPASEDPRVVYAGPFLNVRPEVGYVGDDRFAECHEEIAASFRRHPMARSLTPIARLAPEQSYGADRHNPFEALGSRFQVERRGDAVPHRQTRLGADGRPLWKNDLDVHYAIGSGVHGYSYLTDRGGYVFQTPISWFEQKKIWDLSPRFNPEYLTGRPVGSDCLFCHANRGRRRPQGGEPRRTDGAERLFPRRFGEGPHRLHLLPRPARLRRAGGTRGPLPGGLSELP